MRDWDRRALRGSTLIRVMFVVAALAALATFGLAGCGGGGGSSSSGGSTEEAQSTTGDASSEEAQETTEVSSEGEAEGETASAKELELGNPTSKICNGEEFTIGTDIYDSHGVPYGKETTEGAEETAEEIGCIKFITLDNDLKAEQSLSNVRGLIAQHVDGIVLNSALDAPTPGNVRAIQAAGIPLVTSQNQVDGVTYVEPDTKKSGEEVGKAIIELFKEKYGDSTEPYIVENIFPEGGPTEVERVEGWKNALKEAYPNLPEGNVFATDSQGDPAKGLSMAISSLSAIPKSAPVIVSGESDAYGYPMLQAVQQRGYEAVGFAWGATEEDRELVCGGDYITDAWFPERLYRYIFPALIGEIQGKKIPLRIYTPTAVLTKDTLSKVYPELSCKG